MNPTFRSTAFLFLASVLASAGRVSAADVPTVTVTGHATLKSRPEILRCKVQLIGEGKTMQDAVNALTQHRDDVKQKLIDAGATASAVQVTDVVAGNGIPDQMRRITMFAGRQRGQAATTQPVSFTVSCTLQADWPLVAGSAEEALVKSSSLEDKIKSAIPKAGAKKTLTPEEQEVAEELAAQNVQTDAAEATLAKPDEPAFVFVHQLSSDEKAKLAADAFASAKADGQRMAAAAERTLGSVQQLSTGNAGSGDSNPYSAYIQAMTGGTASTTVDSASEATGPQASSVTKSTDITVSFALQ